MKSLPRQFTFGRAAFVVSLLAFGLVGCDSPEALCEDLANRTCDRAVECVAPDESVAACTDELVAALGCSRVDDVSDGYDACMDRLADDGCGVLFPMNQLELPSVCSGVLLVE